MPVLGGIEATRMLIQAESPPRVLVLTTFDLDSYVYDALRAGASGFLLKDATPEEILHAVRVIGRGEALLAPAVTQRLPPRGGPARARRHPAATAADGSAGHWAGCGGAGGCRRSCGGACRRRSCCSPASPW